MGGTEVLHEAGVAMGEGVEAAAEHKALVGLLQPLEEHTKSDE